MNNDFWKARYGSKPFLRFLDFYVLDAIDQMTDSERLLLKSLEPKFALSFKMTGAWQEVVAHQMQFEDQYPIRINDEWAKYLEAAASENRTVHPHEFAVQFVDQITETS